MAEIPPFTVAVPTCNGAAFIDQAIASILAQEGVAFDLIVSDDRSEDDTLDRVCRLAGGRARVEVNSERLGLAGNWNRCVERSRTPLVAIVHQDDLLLANHLKTHRAAHRPGTGLVASASVAVDGDLNPIPPTMVEPGASWAADRRYPPGGFLRELAVGNPLRCSAVTIRAEAHAAVGGFDPSYRYAVDWDFWIRAAERYEVAWVATTTAAFRWHPASETHRFAGGTVDLEEMERLISDLHARHPDLAGARPLADRRLGLAYLHRAYQASRAGRSSLARDCFRRARALDPATLWRVARDPRLAVRLMVAILRPS